MVKTKGEIYAALKKEKAPKVRSRMLAVHMVRTCDLGVEEATEYLMQSTN